MVFGMQGTRVAVVPFAILAFIFAVASTGGGVWLEKNDEEIGLWRHCNTTTCTALRIEVEDWFNVTRGCMVVACIFSVLSIIMAIVMAVRDPFPPLWTGTLLIITGIAVTVGLGLFAGEVNDNDKVYEDWGYGWSYVVGWLAVPAAFIGALISFVATCSKPDKNVSDA